MWNIEIFWFWFFEIFSTHLYLLPSVYNEGVYLTFIRFYILWEEPLIHLLDLTIINIYGSLQKKEDDVNEFLRYK